MREAVTHFCADIGADILLVQGAGGNVSWKTDNILWVKASGMWLADAEKQDIFTPVDLLHLQQAIADKNYYVIPKVLKNSHLKPSIETLLHALMPHCVVVHLHAVEVLAWLVQKDVEKMLADRLEDEAGWALVDYQKPGGDLAKAVHEVLQKNNSTNLLFLKNHGIVIGGKDVQEVRGYLDYLLKKLAKPVLNRRPLNVPLSPLEDYAPIGDARMHHLVCDTLLFPRLANNWALFPDQVVFLGTQAFCYPIWSVLKQEIACNHTRPELVFIEGVGVYVSSAFTKAQFAQLCCYYHVMVRLLPETQLSPLSSDQIACLLDWDAELYRKRMNL